MLILRAPAKAGDDVELAGIELAVERIREADGDVEIDIRMAAAESGEDVRHRSLHQVVRGAEPHPAAELRAGELRLGGLMGLAAMFSMETWISVIAYPLNIGGRPLYSWPAFIVPAYEWTILWAGLSAAFGMLALNGLPQLYHPLFNAPNFRDGATTDKFFLCLEALDPKFDLVESRRYLETLSPSSVVEVDY